MTRIIHDGANDPHIIPKPRMNPADSKRTRPKIVWRRFYIGGDPALDFKIDQDLDVENSFLSATERKPDGTERKVYWSMNGKVIPDLDKFIADIKRHRKQIEITRSVMWDMHTRAEEAKREKAKLEEAQKKEEADKEGEELEKQATKFWEKINRRISEE